VTKAAADTKGPSVRLSRGSYDGTQASVRYGGLLDNTAYRVYSQWSDRGTSLSPDLTSAEDGWRRFTSGFRADWTKGANAMTTQGTFVAGASRPLWTSFTGPAPSLSGVAQYRDATLAKGTMQARWTHTTENGGALQVQSFADFHDRDDGNGTTLRERTIDLDVQFHTKASPRHDVVVGGGYRNMDTTFEGSFIYSLDPKASEGQLVNVFGQDEIALTDRLTLTLGSKFERDTVAGWGIEPTARLIAQVGARQHLWAAVSRARRTPSIGDLHQRINYAAFAGAAGLPIVLGLTGNPNYQAEHFLASEGGYRIEVGSDVSIDVTVFRGDYHGLPTNEPMAPAFETTPGPAHLFIGTRMENLLDVHTSGTEIVGHWAPSAVWRVDGSYTGLRLVPLPDASSRDAQAALFDGNAPTHQWQVHSSWWLGARVQLNAGLFYVGPLRSLSVPGYTRADARAEMKITRPLSLVIAGQNLFDRAHAEMATYDGVTATLIPRSVNMSLVWRY
jgi:iron complex outermembrane receptor protein